MPGFEPDHQGVIVASLAEVFKGPLILFGLENHRFAILTERI
jgi:hypothetical protein